MALIQKPTWGPQPETLLNAKLNTMVDYTRDRVRFVGDWNNVTAYEPNDLVASGGGKWLALIASTNNTPVEGAGWTSFGGAPPSGAAGLFYATPSGGAGNATLRAIVGVDLPTGIDAAKIGGGLVSNAEFGYLDGVTSAIQTQFNGKAPLLSPAFTGTPTAPTAAAGTNTTQIATMAAVKTAIDALVAGAPGALDTLNEIALKLADDESAVSALTTTVAGKEAAIAPGAAGTYWSGGKTFLPLNAAAVAGLGGAATLNVGTTAGTVMDGGTRFDLLSPLGAGEIPLAAAATLTLGRQHLISDSATPADYTLTLPALSAGSRINVVINPAATKWFTVAGTGVTQRMRAGESVTFYSSSTAWIITQKNLRPCSADIYLLGTPANANNNLNSPSVPNGATGVLVPCNTERFKRGMATDLATGKIIVTRDGVYNVTAALTYNAINISANTQVQILKNGVIVAQQILTTSANGSYPGPLASRPIECAVGDFLQVYAFQNSGRPETLFTKEAGNWISAVEIIS